MRQDVIRSPQPRGEQGDLDAKVNCCSAPCRAHRVAHACRIRRPGCHRWSAFVQGSAVTTTCRILRQSIREEGQILGTKCSLAGGRSLAPQPTHLPECCSARASAPSYAVGRERYLLGGHVEPFEHGSWAAAAAREAQEELPPLRHRRDFVSQVNIERDQPIAKPLRILEAGLGGGLTSIPLAWPSVVERAELPVQLLASTDARAV